MIQKLLIANRGEIACRVMKTAQAMGIKTVAVYSDSDADAPHVQIADQAVLIGPAPVAESYLDANKVLAAARESGADAIHPGYGFLSENAGFAKACTDAGLKFIGPSAEAIDLMGDKARAKRSMIAAGVPCVPGYQGDDQADDLLRAEAVKIGFPLMIKAAAGGGGRGMRLVHQETELASAISTARSEAINAFGAGELIIEKAIIKPRHVEIQVFGDAFGNIVYLGERDCSVQRRHQKVIEEAPCPVMTPELRAEMGQAAVKAAAAVNYQGAGTVEFLLGEDQSFYFLEMNTRLQVEHPVTESITGLDLVELQLNVAAGQPLGFTQDDVRLRGHAIEIRLYAEDPAQGFLPSTGHIAHWLPPTGTGIRVDSGVETGSDVSPYYDPMLAKVIASGETREQARRRLVAALSGSLLVGPANNRDFLIDALSRPSFVEGQATTAFIEEEYREAGFHQSPSVRDLALAALLQTSHRAELALKRSAGVNAELLNWSSSVPVRSIASYRVEDIRHDLLVEALDDKTYQVTPSNQAEGAPNSSEFVFKILAFGSQQAVVDSDGVKQSLSYFANPDELTLSVATETIEFTVTDISAGETAAQSGGSGQVTAPMHGQLLELFVVAGSEVVKGQALAILEAMKMQHEITAEVSGKVAAIHAEAQTQVAADQLLMEIEAADEDNQ